MLITATVVRQDGTIGEVDQGVFGFSHVIGFGQGSLANLTDVSLTDPTANQVLTYNGSVWVNGRGVVAILTPVTVFNDYSPTSNEEITVNAEAGAITIQLPAATGSGSWFHVKKIDATDNVVTVAVNGSDVIDDSSLVALTDQWADCLIIDAIPGYWDQVGSSSGGAELLSDLADVDINTPTDTQVLTYDAGSDKWINADSQGGGGGSTWGTITGTLSSQTDLQTALDAKVPTTRTVNGHALSSNVTVSASDVGAPSGSGTSTGTNTGDQDLSGLVPKTTTVNGHALSSNVSVTAGDVGAPSGSGTCSGTNTGDQTSIIGISGTLSEFNTALTGADFATGGGTVSGTSSGTNTGDQTTVSGNAGTATALATARNIDGQSFNGTADITVIAPGTHAASSKTTPADADEIPLVDSAASNVLKKLTWANLKATAKTYFDTLYVAISGALGTPASGTLTNCTGLPMSGITSSTSANLRTLLSDENGTGAALFNGATTPDFTTGFTIGTAAASGKIPIGNGTNYVASTPTFPNSSATSGKVIKADGTNWVASTETFPAATTNGAVLTSDGTNWTNAFPGVIILTAKSISITTSGSPKDIATITIPAGITRWRPFSGSATANLTCLLNESQTGTMAAASFTIRDAASGFGNIIYSATNPGATSPLVAFMVENSQTLVYTNSSLVVRQTADPANTGVISFYLAIQPLL